MAPVSADEYIAGLLAGLGLDAGVWRLRYNCFHGGWPVRFLGFLALLASGGRPGACRIIRSAGGGLVAHLDHGSLPASEPVEVEVPGVGRALLYPAILAERLAISSVAIVDFIPFARVTPVDGRPGLAVYTTGGLDECWEGPALIPAPGGLPGLPLGGGLGVLTVRFDQRHATLWARGVPSPGLHGSKPVWASCGVPVERGPLVDVLQYVFEDGIFEAQQGHASRRAWMLLGTVRSKGVDYAVVVGEAEAGILDCLESAAARAGAAFQAVPGRGGGYGFTAYIADGGEDDAYEIAGRLRASCLEGGGL